MSALTGTPGPATQAVPVHESIQSAKAAGVQAGDLLVAQLAPADGPTGVKAESPVVVVAKKFWQSPTIIWIRNLIAGAFLTAATFSFGGLALGQAVDWHAVLLNFRNAFVVAILLGIVAYKKSRDNNPVV
jgi:hypothetical protein